ncbi:kunitz-type protease inhibitor 2 isoform X2 [Hemicordylus capensis]|nr:kunitz-type protease inhibitor 2 isoform X2 [Hemicordylus capensis]XP_053123338.1 kunitz-type protease inhibitor 2 isoform X2 [Hemicordylus capensis]
MVVSRCRASFPRWRYNATSQACEKFIYGGCRSNSNNFLTREHCLQACAAGGDQKATEIPLPSEGGTALSSTKEQCTASKETGLCRAAFRRWYFDTETRSCKMFIYGGCGGNANNYELEEACLRQCAGKRESSEDLEGPSAPPRFFPDSTRAVVLAVLLAIMAALLLGSTVVFCVKLCRKSQELSLGTVWSTLDDKEYLMSSNAHTL